MTFCGIFWFQKTLLPKTSGLDLANPFLVVKAYPKDKFNNRNSNIASIL
jgi:hypothetical protein